MSQEKPKRLAVIDMMVGLTMMLVVLGHMSVGFEPDWYSFGLHNWIYSFHMELFVFLSAFLIRYSYKSHLPSAQAGPVRRYFAYIWRKAKKFVPWYVIIGIAVALLACPLKGHSLNGQYLLDSALNLLLYPRYCEASFLWYIYLLFGFYIISPLFFKLPPIFRVICCIGAMFLPSLHPGHLLCANDFCQFFFFYCLGVLCADWIDEIRSAKKWLWALLAIPFVAYSVWIATEGFQLRFTIWQLGWWTTVTGVAALPFFYLLGKVLVRIKPVYNALTAVSKNCYAIYLSQMFVIWGCTWAMMKSGLQHKGLFVLFMTVATLLAIVLPILTMRIFTSKKRVVEKNHPAKNTSLK